MTLTQAELDFEVKRDRRLRTFKRQNKQFVGCWCLTSLTRYWHKCGSAGRKGKDLIKSGGNISTWECNIYFHGDTLIYIHIRVSKWDHHSLKRFNGGEIIILSTQATKLHLIWQRGIGCSKAGCSWWCWPGGLWEGRPPARWSPRCRTIFSAQLFRRRKLFDPTFHHRQFSSWSCPDANSDYSAKWAVIGRCFSPIFLLFSVWTSLQEYQSWWKVN